MNEIGKYYAMLDRQWKIAPDFFEIYGDSLPMNAEMEEKMGKSVKVNVFGCRAFKKLNNTEIHFIIEIDKESRKLRHFQDKACVTYSTQVILLLTGNPISI
ncbi:hypothetical protein RF11_05978 [Thelohanellus kitauei]|uniref:Uncharacterized protein n=1 Tax=Thelohanellus kitauei TaxID=669202 RepID=A0A0C2MCX3_THEKT|nr:hypothetical protein RF11_05978 [Thelohanellus kitauei]